MSEFLLYIPVTPNRQHCSTSRALEWNQLTFTLTVTAHNLIDLDLFMASHKAFLEQCILKCSLTLILVGGHNEIFVAICLAACGSFC